jgi:hypothetical protein
MAHAILVLQLPDGALREVALQAPQFTIGRDPTCDLVLDGRLISRQHARIVRHGAAYVIEDLHSRNGTTVNGRVLGEPHTLHDGDEIELGGISHIVFVDSDATSTRPLPPPLGVWLDHAAHDVWINGQRLTPPLSGAQFALLALLATQPDTVYSREAIVQAVWPDIAHGVSDEALDALIKRVRARLSEVPGGGAYLVTLRGRGLLLKSNNPQAER